MRRVVPRPQAGLPLSPLRQRRYPSSRPDILPVMPLSRRAFLGASSATLAQRPAPRLNVLLLTVDDMNWNTPNCFGGKVPGLTPNIDRLASQGLRFEHGHVTIAVCQPCRSSLMTGRYPHRNGAEGFQPIRTDVPTLQERLQQAGYFLGIFSKVEHLAPRAKFCWDVVKEQKELGRGRVPQRYYEEAKAFFAQAKQNGKPFFLMANSDDPHRPYADSADEKRAFGQTSDFTRRIPSEEAWVPDFLPDIPGVRKELAEYYTSAHRADQTVGKLLEALDESGQRDNTLVVFLSDNGIALPFAKTNCYLHSTKTPWIVRWPGVTRPASVNRQDFIAGIDFTPTILEATAAAPLDGLDGRSFVPVLKGRKDAGRDRVFTVFHETSARKRFEMRCVQERRFGYIWNAWADGARQFQGNGQAGLSWKAMVQAAPSNPAVAARVKLFSTREREELYDFAADPDGLRNLANDPKFQPELRRFRTLLRTHLQAVQDPQAAAYATEFPA